MNFKFIYSALFIMSLTVTVNGQKNDTIPWTGDKLIEHGTKQYDNDNYEESLKFFNRVSKCDPTYSTACYETALVYQSTKEYAKGLIKINEADSLEPDNVNTITLKGSILDDLEQRKEAIELLESASKKWPYNHLLLYNLAIVYVNVMDYHKAEKLLYECVKLSPYHSGTHFLLGSINYRMGRMAQAVLAYNMGLTLNPTSNSVNKFEKIVTGKSESKPDAFNYPYDVKFEASRWNELTRFCNSGLAFRKDFPYNFTTNYLINRLSFLLFQKMEFIESDSTIYNQFYVRFFKEILNRNELNVFFNYQLQGIENKDVNSWNKANNSKQAKFIKFAQSAINEWREYEFSISNEKNKVKTRLFDEDGRAYYIGTQLVGAELSKEGKYLLFDRSGYISEKGNYTNNKLNGLCTIYWPNGSVKQELNFLDNELDGINKTYFESGKTSGVYPRVKGKKEGNQIKYASNGKIVSNENYINDLEEGKSYNYYSISGWLTESNHSKGKLSGPYTERWINGAMKMECNYVDSLMNGPVKKWYSNAKLESVNESKKDYFTGPFTLYHTNGVLHVEGTYNDSTNLIGSYTEYSRSAKKIMHQSAFVNGKKNGVQTDYYVNGNIKNEYHYENDNITKIICYDQNNNIHYQTVSQNGLIAFKYFYDNTAVKREGNLKNGKRDGEWHELSGGGIITSLENWKDDMQTGFQKTYYESGNIKSEYYCDSNLIEGSNRIYFPNGTLKSIGYYKKGKGNGEFKFYYSNGKIRTEYYLIDDEICGRRFDYTPEGNIENITEYEDEEISKLAYYSNNKLEQIVPFTTDSSLVMISYPNGKPKYRFTLVNGLKQGLYEMYYPNGTINVRQEYLNGKLNGQSKVWDEEGNLSSLFTYNLDKVEGYQYVYKNGKVASRDYSEEGIDQEDFREYYPNGKLFRLIPYIDDDRDGEYSFFSPDSVKLFSLVYDEGSVTSVLVRNKQGKMDNIAAAKLNEGLVSSYYPNGIMAATIPLVKGYLNGTLTMYYENGNKLRQREYKNDYLEGKSVDYYANGKIRTSTQFANDVNHGEYVRYTESGVKALEGSFEADSRTGVWTYYDLAGKIKYKVSYENDNAYEIK